MCVCSKVWAEGAFSPGLGMHPCDSATSSVLPNWPSQLSSVCLKSQQPEDLICCEWAYSVPESKSKPWSLWRGRYLLAPEFFLAFGVPASKFSSWPRWAWIWPKFVGPRSSFLDTCVCSISTFVYREREREKERDGKITFKRENIELYSLPTVWCGGIGFDPSPSMWQTCLNLGPADVDQVLYCAIPSCSGLAQTCFWDYYKSVCKQNICFTGCLPWEYTDFGLILITVCKCSSALDKIHGWVSQGWLWTIYARTIQPFCSIKNTRNLDCQAGALARES